MNASQKLENKPNNIMKSDVKSFDLPITWEHGVVGGVVAEDFDVFVD